MLYDIIVGTIIVFCIVAAAGGALLAFASVLNFVWLVVTKQWDRNPREYGNHMNEPSA